MKIPKDHPALKKNLLASGRAAGSPLAQFLPKRPCSFCGEPMIMSPAGAEFIDRRGFAGVCEVCGPDVMSVMRELHGDPTVADLYTPGLKEELDRKVEGN